MIQPRQQVRSHNIGNVSSVAVVENKDHKNPKSQKIPLLDSFFMRQRLKIIMRCHIFFLFIGRKPTTCPASKCPQIMVFACAMSYNCVWLQIIFCSPLNETMLFSFFYHHSCVKKGRSLRFPKIFIKNKLGNRMIKQLLSNLKQKERKMIQGANIDVFHLILVHELCCIISSLLGFERVEQRRSFKLRIKSITRVPLIKRE